MKQTAPAVIMAIVLHCTAVSVSAEAKSVAVIFDMSASMQEFQPKLIAELWVTTFMRTFPAEHELIIAGFGQNVSELMRVSLVQETGQEVINAMRKIESHELITDYERPLSYIAGFPGKLDLVIFITDGKPDIWDKKNNYLSKTIRRDGRYADLNREYEKMQGEGYGKEERHAALADKYESRNFELINGQLTRIAGSRAGALVFFDLSGKWGYIPDWAKQAGAKLVVANIESGADPDEELRKSFMALQEISSAILGEPLPPGFERKIEPLPGAKMRDSRQKARSETGGGFTAKALVLAFGLPGLLTLSGLYYYYTKKRNAELAAAALLAAETAAVKVEEAPDFPFFDDSGYISAIKNKYRAMASTSLESARRFINAEIMKARESGDMEKLAQLQKMLETVEFDRRFDLRVAVPPGDMHVNWRDAAGAEHKSGVINISMKSFLFDPAGGSAVEILSVESEAFSMRHKLEKCDFKTRQDGQIVAFIENFEDNITGWTQWIEIVTRMGETE